MQRQRLVFYDLTSVQHGTHHCLHILCNPNPKGEQLLCVSYDHFLSVTRAHWSIHECKLHMIGCPMHRTCHVQECSNSKLLSLWMMTHDKVIISTWVGDPPLEEIAHCNDQLPHKQTTTIQILLLHTMQQ